jgi:hypothetical protein
MRATNQPLKADNKLCYQRDIEIRQRIHRQKLATMRPTSKSNSRGALDNTMPQRHRHLELKLKKRQLDDENYTKIERENRILMEKMYSIMKSSKSTRSMEFKPGMRINSNQGPMVDCFLSQKSLYPGQAVPLDSLNRDSRRRDYMRIMEENMSILKRIQDRKPNYQRTEWSKDRDNVDGYLKNIKVDSTTGYLSGTASLYGSSSLRSVSRGSSRGGRSIKLEPIAGGEVMEGPRSDPFQLESPTNGMMGDDGALYSKGKRIGAGHYHVQFYCDDGTNLRVRGTQVGAEEPGRALEWNFSDLQLVETYGVSTPWAGQDTTWFNSLLAQLKEEEANVIFTGGELDDEGLE